MSAASEWKAQLEKYRHDPAFWAWMDEQDAIEFGGRHAEPMPRDRRPDVTEDTSYGVTVPHG